ncbi:MAG: hypothetical protein HY078_09620 [Elusimicrobia bacterium]|nr:hypothetical protein [Elusimicrobiota bacterium]
MRTILKVVGVIASLYLVGWIAIFPFVGRPTRRAEAVRKRIKTGMTPAEVVEILEHPDQDAHRLFSRHYFVLEALTAAEDAACAARKLRHEGDYTDNPAITIGPVTSIGKPLHERDCTGHRSEPNVLGSFPEALNARIKAMGKTMVLKAEIHADFHIFQETEYVFVVSFGRDGKVASVGDGSMVTY